MTEPKSASAVPGGSKGGGRPSILAMDLAPAAAWVQSEVVTTPNWTIGHFADASFGGSAPEVLEVFHQPLEAIISLRRYIARVIHRSCGVHRTGARVGAQVRARYRDIGTNWLLGAAVAAEAVARTSASERAIFELVNMACLRCAVLDPFYRSKYSREDRRFPSNRGLV